MVAGAALRYGDAWGRLTHRVRQARYWPVRCPLTLLYLTAEQGHLPDQGIHIVLKGDKDDRWLPCAQEQC